MLVNFISCGGRNGGGANVVISNRKFACHSFLSLQKVYSPKKHDILKIMFVWNLSILLNGEKKFSAFRPMVRAFWSGNKFAILQCNRYSYQLLRPLRRNDVNFFVYFILHLMRSYSKTLPYGLTSSSMSKDIFCKRYNLPCNSSLPKAPGEFLPM